MRTANDSTTRRVAFTAALAASAILFLASASAAAASAAARWHLDAIANSTAAPGGTQTYSVQAYNVGDADLVASAADPIIFTVELPPGLTASSVTTVGADPSLFGIDCTGDGAGGAPGIVGAANITCTKESGVLHAHNANMDLSIGAPVPFAMAIVADVADDPLLLGSAPTARFEVSGAGAPAATLARRTAIAIGPAPFAIQAFDGQVSAADGSAFTQAGGHPDAASTSIDFTAATDPRVAAGFSGLDNVAYPVEPPRDIRVDLPPGFLGGLAGVAQCTAAELAGPLPANANVACDPASQIGTTTVRANNLFGSPIVGPFPLFNMVPPPGVPARFGFQVAGSVALLDAHLRGGGDYGISIEARNIVEALPIAGADVTVWGVPADPIHDPERACPGELQVSVGGPSVANPGWRGEEQEACAAAYTRPPLTPLLRNPTACAPAGQGLTTTARADSWEQPGEFVEASFESHQPPTYPADPDEWGAPQGPTGCDQVPFTPSFSVQPTSHAADSPTGLEVDLSVPQDSWQDPEATSQSDLRDAVVTLPAGMTVNPSSADGLGACSSSQIALGSDSDPTCPDSSKIGTLSIETPLLDHDVPGVVYLAKQGDNPFGSLLGLYLVARDPVTGVTLKLAGRVDGDQNGTLTTTFVNQPQLPFSNLHLELKSGPRAPLVNPSGCGVHTATATLTGWSGAVAHPSSSFQIATGPDGGPCGTGFDPAFEAGLTSQIASTSSPFVLRLSRRDGEQQLSALDVKLPEGLTGVLRGVPYCPDAIASGSGECPADSRLGTVHAGAGAGPSTFYVPEGSAFLAGPYKGAPLSIVVSVPAIAGPFDLGNVVVRSQLQIDPATTRIDVVSDPLPQAVMGVAVHLRNLYVAIDRSGFIVPPTNCDPMSTDATIGGVGGAVATPSSPFQMLLCGALDFRPKFNLRLKGPTKRSGNPKLIATLRARAGDANIDRVQVTLPPTEFLDQSHIRTVCTRVQFAADRCPARSIYGRASATSPLLDYKLTGPVYLRSSNHKLPDLVAALRGPDSQPIEIELAGRTDTFRGALRNTFDLVPDAPVSAFRLELFGGKRGLVENNADLCGRTRRATFLIDGQNGKTADQRPVVGTDCGKTGRKGKRASGSKR